MVRLIARDARISLEAASQDSADLPALVTDAGVLTFGMLALRARRVAADLVARGLTVGPVAIVATLRSETVVAIGALIDIGTPIVLLHPRLTASERALLVAQANVSHVLDESWSDNGLPDAPTPSGASAMHDPESALAILFTSGSTGSPKGVVLSRRAFSAASAASAANVGWRDGDRWLLCMPLAHVGGLSVIIRCLAARIPVVMSPWTGSIAALLADVSRHRATLLSLVPTMLTRILEDGPLRPFPDHVRAVFIGGDAARPSLLRAATARGVPVLTTYGLTEACSQVATQVYGEAVSLDGAVGPPLPGVEVRIVDGEIQVRGPNLLTCYCPRERFGSPLVDGGWLPTGDQGDLDERGRLRIRGRRSDLIITGGENVDPAEVERVLSGCPGVRDVCVFGVEDERWGQIVAVAIVQADPPPSALAVANYARDHLAAHKRPRVFAFCDALPLGSTGKLDRRSVAATVSAALVPLRAAPES